MENEADALPPILLHELIAQLLESKAQAERGEVVSAAEVLAEIRARFEALSPSHVRRESNTGDFAS